MDSRPEPDPELILAHASWLEGLARRMARDPHEAEDLLQEAWLAWLKRPRAAVLSTRRWMAGVITKHSAQRRRADGRRAELERRAAELETPRGAAETVERAQLGRDLLEAVLALDEPFRAAVLMRYYEDLAPPEIARRLGVPVRTVNSRLGRGLERLRTRWKRAHGEGELGALALVAGWPRAPLAVSGSAWTTGIGIMNMKLVLGICLGVVCVGGVWRWRQLTDPPLVPAVAPEADAAAPDSARATGAAAASGPSAASEPALRVAGSELAPDARAVPIADDLRLIHGRVLDMTGSGLAGVEVGTDRGAGESGTSGAGGHFELGVPDGELRIAATDPQLVTVVAGRVKSSSAVEPLVVVARHRALAGTVVDEAGLPLQGARVQLSPPPHFASRFDGILDAAETGEWLTGSAADGRFELERAPVFGEGRLEVQLDGFEPASLPAPVGAATDLYVTLARPPSAGFLAGRVVDPDRLPAPGCQVSLGGCSAVTDLRGEFRLDRADAPDGLELIALRPGNLPGTYRAARDPLTGAPSWPDFVELTLGGEPLTIRGRVSNPAGEPLPGLHVWVRDPTDFGEVGVDTRARVEYLLAMSAEDYGDGDLDGANWADVRTDDAGRFELRGLLARDYALHVMDERALVRIEAGPFAAGTEEARIVFDAGELRPLRARVVRANGAAVPGVQVRVLGQAYGGIHFNADVVTSDEEGRVVVPGLGHHELRLWLRGDDVVPTNVDLPAGAPEEELELVVSVRCHFKVDLGPRTELADALNVLDADGERLELYRVGATGVTIMRSAPIVAGRSENLGVEESASTLVLKKDGEVVSSTPLHLSPGRLEIVRP